MHERHRSPYQSPLRSLSRWSKCPKERKLRTTERSKWPRNSTVLGWSDPTFAHGSVAKVNRGSLQPNKKLLAGARVCGEDLGEAGEEGRNYLLQLRLHHLLHLVMRISLGKRGNRRHENEKSDAEKNTRSGGSDPAFWRTSRPKVLWGRSRPRRHFVPRRIARLRGRPREFVRQFCLTFCTNTKGEARCPF